MIQLAIDTSTEQSIIAVVNGVGKLLDSCMDTGRRHGRDLIPRLKSILASAGVVPGELEAIGVGLGPGSYTGTRVGVTAAKTLAYATGAALIGLDSLEAVGRDAPADATRVWVIADAQRGEVYVAELHRAAAGEPLTPAAETRIEPLTSWAAGLKAGSVVLGPALDLPRIRSSISAAFLPPSGTASYPLGRVLIEMTREAIAAGRRDSAWLLEPRYLRRSAAEDQWDARRTASSG